MKKILVSFFLFMQFAAYAQFVGAPYIIIPFPHPTSNGTALVSAYNCNTASAETLVVGTPVSGVTQTITATVTTVGTYSISTIANGVTFAATGTFAGTGARNIILTASGTPTSATASPYTYTLNTTPNCSFTRAVNEPSSNGSAVVSAYSCTKASAGTMTAGVAVSSVTQTITATVTTVGTYSISTIANGVTFAATGTFADTGAQDIMLTATGTPTAAGSNTFTLNTIPNCNFSRTTSVNPSSNGNADVSAYSCSIASAGEMTAGVAVSGVKQTIRATVTTVGTYSISTTANGVTFEATGTFAGTGARNIVLTATGTPTSTTASPYTYTLNTTPNCSFTRAVTPIPANLTLGAISPYFVASVYDQDYLPYTAPTVTASLATAQAAGGGNETPTLNVQGILTTTGVTLKIPYTVVKATVSLPAFSQTINVPASFTEDGIARDVTFSYGAASLGVGSGTISATLQAVGGTLNAKKLDIQTGIGNDNLGWLLAQFTYATNSSGGTANFEFRNIASIPDRNIADANHVMFYMPVLGNDGKTWLNNNLGADYANTAKTGIFNPATQATTSDDFKAYGSMFQWGRGADGHELITWSSGTAGTGVNGTIAGPISTPWTSTNFITNESTTTYYDWRTPQDNNLWQGVSGTNNPCPIGYRLPTETEMYNLTLYWFRKASDGAFASPLKLPVAGFRFTIGYLYELGTSGNYWSSTVSGSGAFSLYFYGTGSGVVSYPRAVGGSVRCLKD